MELREMNQRFTLIELLIVISIIAILSSMLLPQLSKARAKSKEALCLNNIKQQLVGFHIYADDHDENLPPGGGNSDYPSYGPEAIYFNNRSWSLGLGTLHLDNIIKTEITFFCPLAKRLSINGEWGWESPTHVASSYVYRATFNLSSSPTEANLSKHDPGAAVLSDWFANFSEFFNHVNNLNVGKLDGSAYKFKKGYAQTVALAPTHNNQANNEKVWVSCHNKLRLTGHAHGALQRW